MRRKSDRLHGRRTGKGRRQRDQLLRGELRADPAIAKKTGLEDAISFAAEDLREGVLAVGALESFLLSAKNLLGKADLTPAEVNAWLSDDTPRVRIELLSDALLNLRLTIQQISHGLE